VPDRRICVLGVKAPLQNLQHVLKDRPLQGSDDADALGKNGEVALPRELEQAFPLELALEFLEPLLQAPLAPRPYLGDLDLVLPARLVNRNHPPHQYRLAILQREADAPGLALEHDRGECRAEILQREIKMPGSGRTEIGNLSRNPDLAQLTFEQIADRRRQFRDGKRMLRRIPRCIDLEAGQGFFGGFGARFFHHFKDRFFGPTDRRTSCDGLPYP